MNSFQTALNATISTIKENTPSSVQHRVWCKDNGLRTFIKDNWVAYRSKHTESFLSPCGKYRSLVVETGVVMLTTVPADVETFELKKAKTQHTVKLTAILENGDAVSAQNWHNRSMFVSDDNYFEVSQEDGNYVIITPKGTYDLIKHSTNNYYHTVAKGVKVHVMLKKMVGTLIYWA